MHPRALRTDRQKDRIILTKTRTCFAEVKLISLLQQKQIYKKCMKKKVFHSITANKILVLSKHYG